ncbi:MAG TPA: ATP-binding protein [Opitutaceae bacterium]|nr:ATP-binding protein [Opitutaceae bacterium]
MDGPVRNAVAGRWYARPLVLWSCGIVACVLAGIAALELLRIPLFEQTGLPHEFCYRYDPRLIWVHVIADLVIGISYVSISATLGYLVYRASRGIPFHSIFLAFGLFIVSCGFTHFLAVLVVWQPLYWLDAFVKVVTAAASLATAIALFPLLPRVFAFVESARRGEKRRVEIEQLNEELERFNYSVAHDLRGPLRGISGFSDALREDCGGEISDTARLYLNRIRLSVGKMDALVTNLLKYASIGRQQLQLRSIDLGEVLATTIGLLEPEIQLRHGEVRIDTGLPRVIGDPMLVQVVFQNLIGNALKYVALGVPPQVHIAARTESAELVVITVTDNGVGIPGEARQRIFRIFERFDNKHEGTGIGLAIVQRAVERMHGTIEIEDPPGGSGAQFSIRLPVG